MKDFEPIYLPVGVPTFHLESAREEFRSSCDLLKGLCENVRVADDLLLSLDALDAFTDGADPDLIIFQNATFANAAYAEKVLNRFPDVPILLWGLREPVIDGGRLRLNSLTGSFSAANMIKQHRKEPLDYVFGSPSEEEVIKRDIRGDKGRRAEEVSQIAEARPGGRYSSGIRLRQGRESGDDGCFRRPS